MTSESTWTEWLPEAGILEQLTHANLDEAISEWSAKWMGFGSLGFPEGWSGPASNGGDFALWNRDGSIGLWLSPTAHSLLQNLMFGAVAVGEKLTARDLELLEQSVELCVQDLCDRLVTVFNFAGQQTWGRRTLPESTYTCAIGKDIVVMLSNAGAVRWVKRELARPPEGISLHTSSEALQLIEVTLGAIVGHCHLTLRDLGSLAIGDVLTLDRDLSADADLVVNNITISNASCRLIADHDGLSLTFR